MINEHQITINSTSDISEILDSAERRGIRFDYFNACIYLRGSEGSSIEVGRALKGLYVVACGPATVHVREGASVIAEGRATVHVYAGAYVRASDRATVHAYETALVDLDGEATAHVASDDVEVLAREDSLVYLPAEGLPGAQAYVDLWDSAKIARGDVQSN